MFVRCHRFEAGIFRYLLENYLIFLFFIYLS
jgi:hypothetical protein